MDTSNQVKLVLPRTSCELCQPDLAVKTAHVQFKTHCEKAIKGCLHAHAMQLFLRMVVN